MSYLNPVTYYRDFRVVFRKYKAAAFLIDTVSSVRTWVVAWSLSAAYPAWATEGAGTAWAVTRDYTISFWELLGTLLSTS